MTLEANYLEAITNIPSLFEAICKAEEKKCFHPTFKVDKD